MTPNLLAKERHTNCSGDAMSNDGNGKGKWNLTKGRERWNTGLQSSPFAANRTGLHRTSITRREWKQPGKTENVNNNMATFNLKLE